MKEKVCLFVLPIQVWTRDSHLARALVWTRPEKLRREKRTLWRGAFQRGGVQICKVFHLLRFCRLIKASRAPLPCGQNQNEAAISPSVTSPPLLYSPKLQFFLQAAPLSLQSPAWKLFYQSPGAAKQNPQRRWWKTDTADCKNLKTFVSGIMHEPRE